MCGTVTVGGDSNSERGQIEDRPAITIRKAGDEVEAGPGFFEGDTVALALWADVEGGAPTTQPVVVGVADVTCWCSYASTGCLTVMPSSEEAR